MQKTQRVSKLGRGIIRERAQFPIRLVDEHEVRQFHDAALDGLKFVTAPGLQQQDKHVGHVGYHGLGLPDPYGFHDDHVESCRFTHDQGLATSPCDAAQGSAGR